MRRLDQYSIGVGDRFARQGRAQLQALIQAREAGAAVVPVWNKSHREHTTIKSSPADVRREADSAVSGAGWTEGYYVDADHIGMGNVDLFLESSDFFTLDVADFIGERAGDEELDAFVQSCSEYTGRLAIPGIEEAFDVSEASLRDIAAKYLFAAKEAGKLYRHIAAAKGEDTFVTEVSMDETDSPQTPEELFFILAALAAEGIPAQTVAPKFTGRFNKGVDYVGSVDTFRKEFEQDICVIAHAVDCFGLPDNLKLSVHSGSDKFSLYRPMGECLRAHKAGVHLKTAGTTWLEELIGLALAGGDGLAVARDVYRSALDRSEELCAPYASVIDIDTGSLPSADEVDGWSGEAYAVALRHDPGCGAFNSHFRQLLHVAYKVAAEMGERYIEALERFEPVIAPQVTANIYERHLKPLFLL